MATAFEKKKVRHASGESTMSADSVSNYIPTPPDGGYGWVICFASFFNHIIVDGIAFTFGVFFMEFLEYFGESKAKTALVGSLLCGFYLMTGPIASALTNKFGCRPVCIVGGVIASVSFGLCTLSPNLDTLIFLYGVMGGFGLGLVYLPSVISVSYYFEKKRALATGIAVCGAGVGCFIFAPVGKLLLEHYDWKNAMLIVSAFVLNSVVCGMLMRPLEPPRKRKKPRRKNVLDRLKERAMSKTGLESESGEPHENGDVAMKKVQEVKLLREQALRDEESDTDMSLPGSVLNSVRRITSRQNSLSETMKSPSSPQGESILNSIPQVVVEEDEHANGEGEKSSLLVVDKAKTPQNEKPTTPENGKTIPPALLNKRITELTNGNGMNGSLPTAVNKIKFAPEVTIHGDHQLTIPQNNMNNKVKSVTLVSDVWAGDGVKRRGRFPLGVHREDYSRPMYRQDIFYSGSVLHIPQFRSQPDMKHYVKSVTSIPQLDPSAPESCLCRCLPKSASDTLKAMLDVSLFKDPVFAIACLANAFGMLGLYVPFVYIAERAINMGVAQTQAVFLLSVIGVTNTIGRVAAGFFADFPWVNTLLLHNLALIAGGISCLLNMFAVTYPLMCLFAAFFGLCVATWISLTSIILCNLLGLEKLTNAFGLLTLVRGICSIAGPPLAGIVYEWTNDFNSSFHVGGIMLIIAGLVFCLLHLPVFAKRGKEANDIDDMIMELDFDEDLDGDDEMEDDDKDEEGKDEVDDKKEKSSPVADIPCAV